MADNEVAPFDWFDYYRLAEELARREDDASLRTAVGRSYYALFNVARLVVACHDPDYSLHRSRDSHKIVWDKLGALRQRQAKNAVRRGRSLLRERKDADYESQAHDWSRRAVNAISHAGAAIRGLLELLPDEIE